MNPSIPFQMKVGTKSSAYLSTLLVPVFIRLTAEKSLSTVHVVMGNVRRASRRLSMLGKISRRHASSTSMSVSFFLCVVLLAFAFLLSCCTNTVCSAASWGMEKCAGRMRALSPKVSDRGKQAEAVLIKPYVSGLKRVFSAIICLSSMSFQKFCRSEFCCTGDDLPRVESMCVLSNLAGNFLLRDPLISQRTISCLSINLSVSAISLSNA